MAENKSRYEIIKKIGHGGMATVYLAHDKILNRNVAIKLLSQDAVAKDSSALQRFSLEAHAITSLIHPNIVEVYDICDIKNKHFIVMEYVEGHTLKQIVQLRGHLPINESVWIMKQLCSGIMEAHKNKIIHRDIKPQNVLIKNDGTAKIADFGIAVLNNSFDLTSKDTVLGSVHYLAPELSKGENPTMQSDIYSLGIVFFELLTGQVPYTGDSAVAIALKHFKEPLPDIRKFNPNIPQSLVNIIIRATAKDPNERYENVALMLKDLNDCLSKNHLNDPPITLTKNKINNHKEMFAHTTKSNKYKPKKKLNFTVVSLIILSIISVICIVFMLLLTGVINLGANKDIAVPDIINMNITEANDLLSEEYGISIDLTDIQRELSDEVEVNSIIKTIPDVGSKVDIGTKIKVVVSDGQYATIDNYVGSNIGDVTNSLLNTKIIVNKVPIDSDKEPGTIISQDPIAGTKYNPQESFTLTLQYSLTNDIPLELSYLGRSIVDVSNELSSNGARVEIVYQSKDEISSQLVSTYGPNTVLYSEPALGTIYTQIGDNTIKLYCYGE